ncbi:MAG: hypothetical protein ACI4Q3_10295 [Kiritimatiellia bacterium]
MKRIGFLSALGALLVVSGCATWSFTVLRTQKFVDDNNNYVLVDYGRDEKGHESTFRISNGARLPFRSKMKVRVELPDGKRFVAYQHMSATGNLYKTDDGQWEYFEEGVACVVAEMAPDRKGYLCRFQGVLCASVRNPLNGTKERIRSGAPQGFGRDSSGPRTVEERSR